jgi:host factor-I protein
LPTPPRRLILQEGRAKEVKEILNRKLIRPNLTEIKEQYSSKPKGKKPAPPDQTNAENYYFIRQMNNKTPMVIHLKDGEEIRGIIEWYDRNCIKVHRMDAPNLLIYKESVKYIYKDPMFDTEDNEDK